MKPRKFPSVWLGLIVAACSLSVSENARSGDDFYLQVTVVTGEHSRDSNSIIRKLTVASGQLVYEETYEGARSNRHAPVKKQFKLTKQEQAALISLLQAKHLLVTKTISKPPTQKGFSRYFEIAITSALESKENTVAIEASPATADLKTDPLYQGSIELIEQLYRIIHRTDSDLTMPELID